MTAAKRQLVVSTVVVAFVIPLRVAMWCAGALGAKARATWLRARTAGVPIVAYVVTGLASLLVVSTVFYPVWDAGNLQTSWGGPTLVGAWLTHAALALAVLLVIALALALWRPPGTRSGKRRSL